MSSIQDLASQRSNEQRGNPMSTQEANRLLSILPRWTLVDGRIEREYSFKSYLEGLNFGSLIGKIAEELNHHPDILIMWKRVKLTLSTHSVKGLSQNDFILAANAELKYRELVEQVRAK